MSSFSVSEFYCVQCGNKGIPVVRKSGQYREGGHLKNLYCLNCGTETNHCEIRPFGKYSYDDFQKEFQLGRFVNGKRISCNELLGCTKVDCPYNVNNKCWNANNSYECRHKRKD